MSKPRNKAGQRRGRVLLTVLMLCSLAVLIWFASLYWRIDRVAKQDEAAPSDAIAVFGAAQYQGHPSPVFHARLDHAVSLYEHGMGALVITLGGSQTGDNGLTEGTVGRDYLLAQGIPFNHILAETESTDTEEQVDVLSRLARERKLRRIIVVSDGTHLFRIRALCQRAGLNVLTSPRPAFGTLSTLGHAQRMAHEMLSYTVLQLHMDAGSAHRWMEGREDL